MARGRPNLLFVMTDQQRADSLGCYGTVAIATPHLDRLAAEGVVADHAYCTNPICTPSRASMMTGHHLPRHGVTTLMSEMDTRHVMFPHRLREVGYRTGLVGKLHAQSGHVESKQRHPHDGLDVYDFYYGGGAMMRSPLNAYAPWCRERRPDVYERLVEHEKAAGPIPAEVHMNEWAVERAAAFLDAGDDRPFFLMVSLFDPHNPYDDHPPELESRVDGSKLPPLIPPQRQAWPEAVRRHANDNYFARFDNLSADGIERMRVGYYAEVAYVDDTVGRLLAMLDERGLTGDTLVVFTSDHGDLLGDHGLMVKGPVGYDANIRVPLIVRWPDMIDGGRRLASPVQLNDLTALFCNAAGAETDLPDAIDPLPALRGEGGGREHAICAYRNSGLARGHVPHDPPIHMTVVTDGRWKLCRYSTGGQLFDLVSDPRELNDLLNDPSAAAERDRLQAELDDFLEEERDLLASSHAVPASEPPCSR